MSSWSRQPWLRVNRRRSHPLSKGTGGRTKPHSAATIRSDVVEKVSRQAIRRRLLMLYGHRDLCRWDPQAARNSRFNAFSESGSFVSSWHHWWRCFVLVFVDAFTVQRHGLLYLNKSNSFDDLICCFLFSVHFKASSLSRCFLLNIPKSIFFVVLDLATFLLAQIFINKAVTNIIVSLPMSFVYYIWSHGTHLSTRKNFWQQRCGSEGVQVLSEP